METGKNTISDPAMANSVDNSEVDAKHPILSEVYTNQPGWWEKKNVCRSSRA